MNLTESSLAKMLPRNKNIADLLEAFNAVFPKYEINTVNRVAGFLAQCGHESVDFTVLKENLNYSADGLNKIFPKYFKNAGRDSSGYARNPEKIANVVYANRMGNGDTASGEGWKFRGRGAIQLTGKDNYSRFAKAIEKTLDETVEYTETLQGAIESACWFWKANGLNSVCDSNDVVHMTKKINGGTIGLEDRKKHYEHNKAILSGGESESHVVAEEKAASTGGSQLVKLGSRGELAKKVQEALGVDADGIFGPGSQRALMAWQEEHGLSADGIAGPATLKKLLG